MGGLRGTETQKITPEGDAPKHRMFPWGPGKDPHGCAQESGFRREVLCLRLWDKEEERKLRSGCYFPVALDSETKGEDPDAGKD